MDLTHAYWSRIQMYSINQTVSVGYIFDDDSSFRIYLVIPDLGLWKEDD